MTVERIPRPPTRVACRLFVCAMLLLAQVPLVGAQALPAGSPVLLTEGTGATTRGVAYEAITFRSEPFPVVSPVNWNADKTNTHDQQTRVMLFAMNLALLAGECGRDTTPGCSIPLTADAQDASGRVYPLRVEAVTRPSYDVFDSVSKSHTSVPQDWLYAITLRLDDAMTDTLGDVLVRINLHGLSSNRVRIAVGQSGPGPATDAATEFISPAPAATPPPTPTPTPKQYGPGEASAADATRLLDQATWGPTTAEVTRVQQMGLRAFVDEQLSASPLNSAKGSNFADLAFMPDDSEQPSGCPTDPINDPNGVIRTACLRDKYSHYPVLVQFFKNALAVSDTADPGGLARRNNQLRQRVAFALHQIFVVSGNEIGFGYWMTPYLQALDRGAYGNFRTLLGEITLNPAMGEYLNMNQSTATSPNENYAREVLQLFSVGVNQLKPDGTPVLDAQGQPVPAYTQTTVNEFTRVFTGWNFALGLQVGNPPAGATNFRDPMIPRFSSNRAQHDTGAKTLFGTNIAGCPGALGSANVTCAQNELNAALDVIFNHPNVGPFISKQLIQHLVTSNPSPAYVGRVAAAFDNDCGGLYPETICGSTRGNMKAVVRAVLLDPEARGDVKTASDYGRLREPVQYLTNVLRAINASSDGVVATSYSTRGDLLAQLDQTLYRPPTVFSYYSPDYEVPGTKTVGPAFQILYTTTTLRRANIINTLIYSGIPVGTNNPTGTQLNFAALDALSGEAGKTDDERATNLVNYLDALLLHGTMPAQVREAVRTAVKSIPTSDANFARKRSQAAAYLVTTSPHYDVQR